VGDIVGRGIPAASAMGQVRSALAALAPVSGTPAAVLQQLSIAAERIEGAHLATIVYAVLDPESGVLRYSCAGHPPPLLAPAQGEPRLLWEGRSTPLGALPPQSERAEGETMLEPGDTLLLYSDGLVERRGEPLDVGLERLRRAVAELRDVDVETLCDELVETMRVGSGASDDVALLAVRLVRTRVHGLELQVSAEPEQLSSIRASLRTWLAQAGVQSSEAAEVILAAGEACANAIEHAYDHADATGTVAVEAKFVGDTEIVVAVRDSGRWRDGTASDNRGRGLGIMRALASKVDVSRGDRGTTVTIWRDVAKDVRS
jgi:serine/threonine-protein kinase RsbW